MVRPMKTTNVVRTFGIGLASTWLLVALPAFAQSGGMAGDGGTGGGGKGGGGGPNGCVCTLGGAPVSDLGGLAGAAAIGAVVLRISRRRTDRA
jgi:hypothetical protein